MVWFYMISAKRSWYPINKWNRYLEVYSITMELMVDQFCSRKYPMVFNEITIEAPLSNFVDRTNNDITWNEDIQSCMLSYLRSVCNNIWCLTCYVHGDILNIITSKYVLFIYTYICLNIETLNVKFYAL